MLPSSSRIKRSEFGKVFKKGLVFHSRMANLFVIKVQNRAKNKSQFAFSVSKKVAKKAVVRNRLRRRGYASISRNLNDIEPGFLCVFVLKPESKNASFEDIQNEVKNLLYKAGILKV